MQSHVVKFLLIYPRYINISKYTSGKLYSRLIITQQLSKKFIFSNNQSGIIQVPSSATNSNTPTYVNFYDYVD